MFNKAIRKLILIFIILTSLPMTGIAEDRMTIAYPEFFPFFINDEKGNMEGFFYEIITEAVDHRMGIGVEWLQMPWKRCQHQVRAGIFDGMITVPTKERSTYSRTHPDPLYVKKLKLFTYKGHPRFSDIVNINSIADIKKGGYTVITYSGNGWHKDNVASLNIPSFATSDVDNVWKMLAAKRGDLVIEWPIGAKAGIQKSHVEDKIIETDVSMNAMNFHLLISKQSKYKDILVRFNDVIKTMFKDGSMEKILSRYY